MPVIFHRENANDSLTMQATKSEAGIQYRKVICLSSFIIIKLVGLACCKFVLPTRRVVF